MLWECLALVDFLLLPHVALQLKKFVVEHNLEAFDFSIQVVEFVTGLEELNFLFLILIYAECFNHLFAQLNVVLYFFIKHAYFVFFQGERRESSLFLLKEHYYLVFKVQVLLDHVCNKLKAFIILLLDLGRVPLLVGQMVSDRREYVHL